MDLKDVFDVALQNDYNSEINSILLKEEHLYEYYLRKLQDEKLKNGNQPFSKKRLRLITRIYLKIFDLKRQLT
jgi:hypothetical protein